MRIQSQKTSKRMKIAYAVFGLIVAFYLITLIIQINGGKGDYTETLWDLGLFLSFVLLAYFIFPSDYFEFTRDEVRFRDYRRRSVKVADIDYIYYKEKFILLETKSEEKYEISISNFSDDELAKIKRQFSDLGVRELAE